MRYLLFSFLSAVFFSAFIPLQAQACSHSLCDSAADFLRDSYVKDLSEGFAEAHAIAAVGAMPYIGKTRIDHITLGGQVSVGVRNELSRDFEAGGVNVNGLGQPVKYAAFASYFAGINVGGLLDWFGVITNLLGLPSFASLDKFDILVSRAEADNFLEFGGVEYGFETSYVGIRYQLIPGAGLPILGGWKGIVFGIGYMSSTVRFSELDDSIDTANLGALALGGDQEKFTLESELRSIPLELNTGIEVLFLNVTAGLGVLLNKGQSKLRYERSGEVSDSSGPQGTLDLDLESETEAPASIYYYKMGLELPIFPFIRLGGEAAYGSKGDYSYCLCSANKPMIVRAVCEGWPSVWQGWVYRKRLVCREKIQPSYVALTYDT